MSLTFFIKTYCSDIYKALQKNKKVKFAFDRLVFFVRNVTTLIVHIVKFVRRINYQMSYKISIHLSSFSVKIDTYSSILYIIVI